MPLSPFNETGLYYERSGAGEALVLVHGSWVDGRTWDAVRPALARSFEVVTFDRRGHSRSVLSPESGTIHDDVADLAGLIEALGRSPRTWPAPGADRSPSRRRALPGDVLTVACRHTERHEPAQAARPAAVRGLAATLRPRRRSAQLRPGPPLASCDGAQIRGRPGDRVLDVATGTGMVAAALVRRYDCSVVGLDQSPEMLAGAQAKLEADRRLAEHVTWFAARPSPCPSATGISTISRSPTCSATSRIPGAPCANWPGS